MNIKKFALPSLFLCFTSLVIAQPGERSLKKIKDSTLAKGDTYAIIIGISDYKVVPDLQYAHKDAEAFQNFLLSDAGGRIPKDNIETFLNQDANRPNVGDAISILARKAKPGDRVWFFFAGHGDMEDLTQIENGLLLLYNSPNGNYFGMNDDVLEILDLKRYLSPLAQRGVEMIFIVDACHSGNLKGGVEGVQQTASALTASWGKEYKILSCQPNQLSLESAEWGGGRGLFSFELEEGLKGLADTNNDGTVSMYELQSYIQTNVAKYSEGKQIPLVSGDLSKPIATVNPIVLAALKKEKAAEYPILAVANTKGNEEKYVDSLDEPGKKLYASFNENLHAKQLIWPKDTNALHDYRIFEKKYADSPLFPAMRRSLSAALNDRFNGIVSPLLKGETSYSSRDECYYAAAELDSCMKLLGEQHYMYTNIKARKLYMDAMALTWAMTEQEYNIGYRPTVIQATELLEVSAKLEPNAAYTLSALGSCYTFLFEYEKANAAFQKYLDLRPNDFSARYTLSLIYSSLKQYDKARKLTESLLSDHPEITDLKYQLANIYQYLGNAEKSLSIINELISFPEQKAAAYGQKGVYYARMSQPDSAIIYYQLSKKYFDGNCTICDNNIGHQFFVSNRNDSAKKYFELALAADSTNPFSNFNLATIELKEGNVQDAMSRFIKTTEYASNSTEGFVSNLDLYFEKEFPNADKSLLNKFQKQPYIFNMQYLGYLSVLYAYLRTPGLINNTDNINFLFNLLFNYKQHEAITWYHHACYNAMKKDTVAALKDIEKSLALGYGNYFTLKYDADLARVRQLPTYSKLLKKYFPAEEK